VTATSNVVAMRRRQPPWDYAELELIDRSLRNTPDPRFPEVWADHVHTTNSAQ
jgi:hypothetical protein